MISNYKYESDTGKYWIQDKTDILSMALTSYGDSCTQLPLNEVAKSITNLPGIIEHPVLVLSADEVYDNEYEVHVYFQFWREAIKSEIDKILKAEEDKRKALHNLQNVKQREAAKKQIMSLCELYDSNPGLLSVEAVDEIKLHLKRLQSMQRVGRMRKGLEDLLTEFPSLKKLLEEAK